MSEGGEGPVIDVEARLRAVKLAARDPRHRRSARLARLARLARARASGASLVASAGAASALLVLLWWRRSGNYRVGTARPAEPAAPDGAAVPPARQTGGRWNWRSASNSAGRPVGPSSMRSGRSAKSRRASSR